MNILMLLSKPFPSDARVMKEIRTLLNNGNEISIIFHKKYKEDINEIDGLFHYGIDVHSPSVLASKLRWQKMAFQKALEIYNHFKFDVIHCHDLDTLPIGIKLKKKMDIKVIYDCHDAMPYYFKSGFFTWLTIKMEEKLMRQADHIITVTEPMIEYLQRCNIPITLVRNCSDFIAEKYQKPQNELFTILYIGTFDKSRFFPDIVDIIGNIKNVRLILAGRKEQLYYKVRERSKLYDNVYFMGTVPYDEIISLTHGSNAIICLLNPLNKNHQLTMPTKIYEAMACGRPSIVTNGMYYSEVVSKNNCGVCVFPNAKFITDTIEYLSQDEEECITMGKNALSVAKKEYNWENEGKKLLEVYDGIA